MTVEELLTALVAFLGGTGFNAVLRYLSRNKETNISTEAMLRQEMIDRLDIMSGEIEELKVEVSYWRDRYLQLYKEHADLRAHLGIIHSFESDQESL